ncbi:MAG: hypothetical protein K9N09_08165 [Candidatus Cloacimonetes bacterium]|nr:hypothetical protein [Candidatus Cloacimonadota bacterium]MCF7868659.1 hypothetical protein [Candidatus Cloacimonadota bacterium]
MKKIVIMFIIMMITFTCLLSDEHKDVVQIFEKIYPKECENEYKELFNFWADFIVYLNQWNESEKITENYVNSFLNNYPNVNRFLFLEWSINQRYPFETQKIKSWSEIDNPYPINHHFPKRISCFTDLLIINSEEKFLRHHLLTPINVIATVTEVGEEFTTTTLTNRVFRKTPIKLNILETLGDQFKQPTLIGYMNALQVFDNEEIRYNYYPSIGDSVFVKIWVLQTNQKTDSGEELLIDTTLEIHQIINGIIIKNNKNFVSNNEIAGLSEKTPLVEYKMYWNEMFEKIIGGIK